MPEGGKTIHIEYKGGGAPLKRVIDYFHESLRHKILNDLAGAVSGDLLEDAKVEMGPPSGKHVVNADAIKFVIQCVGELSDEQKLKVREVMQRYKNPSHLES